MKRIKRFIANPVKTTAGLRNQTADLSSDAWQLYLFLNNGHIHFGNMKHHIYFFHLCIRFTSDGAELSELLYSTKCNVILLYKKSPITSLKLLVLS